jgi:hypothetical protein
MSRIGKDYSTDSHFSLRYSCYVAVFAASKTTLSAPELNHEAVVGPYRITGNVSLDAVHDCSIDSHLTERSVRADNHRDPW